MKNIYSIIRALAATFIILVNIVSLIGDFTKVVMPQETIIQFSLFCLALIYLIDLFRQKNQ